MRQFKHLNVPDHWEQYWSKYPQGYTILEALINWTGQVNDMVDSQNDLSDKVKEFREELDLFIESFDPRLREEVTNILSEWQDDGTLDVIISEALETKMDILEDIQKQMAISVKTYGAKGDGETNDTAAFEEAIEELEEGQTLLIPDGEYILNNITINKDNIRIDCRGILWQERDIDGVFITLGNNANLIRKIDIVGTLDIRRVVDFSKQTTGLKAINMYESNLNINIVGFRKNLHLYADGSGCVYNNFYIKEMKDAIENLITTSDNDGWVNENKFYGGRWWWRDSLGVYEPTHINISESKNNNNIFFSPSLEGINGTLVRLNGYSNTLYSPRLEGVGSLKVHFVDTSQYNQVVFGFGELTGDNILDEGQRNTVISRDVFYSHDMRAELNNIQLRGNVRRNPKWDAEGQAVIDIQTTFTQNDPAIIVRKPNGDIVFELLGTGEGFLKALAMEKIEVDEIVGSIKFTKEGVEYGRIVPDDKQLKVIGMLSAGSDYINNSIVQNTISGVNVAPEGDPGKPGVMVYNVSDNRLYVHGYNGDWRLLIDGKD